MHEEIREDLASRTARILAAPPRSQSEEERERLRAVAEGRVPAAAAGQPAPEDDGKG